MNVTQAELDKIAAKAEEIQSVGGSLLSNASYLKKWVEALTPADPPPTDPPAPSLIVGASAHRLNEPIADSMVWANTQVGPIGAYRVFHQPLPATWTASSPLADQGAQEIISYKSADQATVTSFVQSMRPGDLLVFHHEPEGPDYANGAAFIAEWNQQQAWVEAAGGELGMIAGDYQYRPGGNAPDGSYLPDPDKCAFYGVDTYSANPAAGQWDTMYALDEGAAGDNQFWGWYNLVKDLGKPLLVTEYGRGTRGYDPDDIAKRLDIMPRDHTWLLEHGFTHWMYWFEDGQAGVLDEHGTTTGGWLFTDQDSLDMWSGFAKEHNTTA